MESHHLLFKIITLFLFSNSVYALPHFFPNISAIPPEILGNVSAAAWHSFRNFTGCNPGQKNVAGLSKLKQYFHSFGYLTNSSSSNFTDDFDDVLESAIKIYQKNFNLNVTGQLDQSTVDQIVRPRCGVADIINGTSTMNSGKSSSSPASMKFHTVSHYSYFPGEPTWPSSKTDLTYAFLPSNQLPDSAKTVFANAFAKWSQVTPLTFTETESYYSADLRIAFYTGDHGDGEPFDGVLGTLAHAFSPTNGRFHLDDAENWVITEDVTQSTSSTAVDLESVAVHEIGHLLGLGHSSVEEAIMYPTISAGTRKVTLASDDVQGIQELYGSNPNYNGSETTSSQQSDTSGGSGTQLLTFSWTLVSMIALGFASLIM
ncbi:Peptidoglycan binding-like [Dillenia turbinata]|uniref:Peptidoglycan binding-like n=1 Tax=Dillenia turbinata TaxID=194707 RepID=A0AAN8VBK2_9MAGN